ncbi:MAG: cupin domain-containing protein [Candidatus Gorgyraea atricola]|nr:cupin domain-containing protein [Candidatus Gorgyraea atricola]
MDLNSIKESIVTKVYHLTSDTKVPLHKHEKNDEIFYCIKGSGFGVLEDGEVELSIGKVFIVSAGTMHSLRSEENLYVSSFLVPVVDDSLE